MSRYKYVIPEKNGQPVVPVVTASDETIHWVRSKKEGVLVTDKEHPELKEYQVEYKEPAVNIVPNFKKMTVKKLRAYAKEHDIDIHDLRLKADIIARLEESF